ncbi:hypothetical protein TNCV_1886561 [Trichonephila clavipes]|nr:hypothetical protein TNCV_1886561 [Trichonephila clavipes]
MLVRLPRAPVLSGGLRRKTQLFSCTLCMAASSKTPPHQSKGARSPNNKCLCVKRVWPMRRRVNLTSVLRIGITGHALCQVSQSAVCYPTADSMIPARS